MSVESTGLDPYETVLADLRAKRDQLDQAIAAIEAVRAGNSGTPANAALSAQSLTVGEGRGVYLSMSIADAAKKYLAAKAQTQRTPEILAGLKAGGLVLSSKEPQNVIGSVLMRRFNEVGDIVRVERGVWGLKEWFPGRSFKKKGDNGDKGDEASAEGAGEAA